MMNCNRLKIGILVIFCLMVSFQLAAAAGIKERMKQRLPAIAELKANGMIGENNRGYLGYVKASRPSPDLIAAENKDRQAIYNHFAKQQNTTLAIVEKIQGKRKAQKVKPGQFFQQSDGSWHKK